jgi:hypothetical protein
MRLRWVIGSLVLACALSSAACTELLLGDKKFVRGDGSGASDGGGGSAAAGGGGGVAATGGGGSTAPVCENGTAACDGACVVLDTDSLNCGACGHDCLGGGCESGLCVPQVVASAVNDPRGIATDQGFVYWTTGDGSVQRAPKSGGAVETLAVEQESPGAIAVDATYAYWVNEDSGRVVRMAKDGQGKAKSLLTSTGLLDLAVDSQNLYLSKKLKKGEISRVDKNGGGPSTIAKNQPQPTRIGLLGDSVVWSGQSEADDDANEDGTPDGDEGMTGAYIRFAPRGGGEATTLAFTEGQIVGLVAAGNMAVWADAKSLRIRAVAPGLGAPITLATGQDVRGLAADGDEVFWTSAGGTVKRVSTAGGSPHVIAVDITGAGAAAVDGTHVYFTRSGAGGAIYRVAR